ncbi:DUF3131 domain-containing protein [Desulfovibrio sp. JC022]|uniref:DUF3131 domain-containing protein n=1 Tax=Desulfovibrio sp. JC022 TaxID=2593642 RepID=UPI0013D4FBA5|nr:DUF3131 domain-containing protein [Desulfovibrio sp. JC022]
MNKRNYTQRPPLGIAKGIIPFARRRRNAIIKKARSASKLIFMVLLLLICGCKNYIHSSKGEPFAYRTATAEIKPRRVASANSFWSKNEPAQLTEKQQEMASYAWAYFTRTVFPETGLPQGAVGSDSLTMTNVAGYLAALTCAKRIGVLEDIEFHERMTKLVTWLNKMQLNSLGVPNTFYNGRTGQSQNGINQPGEDGHSALDIGRLLTWLRIVRNEFPTHAAAIDRTVMRWNFRKLIDADGLLYGSYYRNGQLHSYREGRFGELQYAAKGFALWGFKIDGSVQSDKTSLITVNNILLPFDNRYSQISPIPRPQGEPRQTGAVTTTAPLLDGMEFNWLIPAKGTDYETWKIDQKALQLAQALYAVQKSRYKVEGMLTARSGHNLDRPPYFVIDSVFALGDPFSTMDKSGNPQPKQACISTRAAFQLWAMFEGQYTDLLMDAVEPLFDQYGGWYAGSYENGGATNKAISLNDNAVILESLAFMLSGPLFKSNQQPGYWELTLKAESFEARGLPPEKFQQQFQPMLDTRKTEPQP